MIIGVIKESGQEQRVALVPEAADFFNKQQIQNLWVESNAGASAFYPDAVYQAKDWQVKSRAEILAQADIVCAMNPIAPDELKLIKKSSVVLGQFNPLQDHQIASRLADQGLVSFSMDLIPRTTRAQSMDVLSSMATLAGYKAVLVGASHLPHIFPMFMTAAGSIKPAKVLVLGAGVAGLQAIATAKRLGAIVEAFDVRAAAKEEVMSLGAKFVEVEGAVDDKSAGGYAVEQSEEFRARQTAKVQEHASKSDVIICTAQIPGRKAPILVTEDTVKQMQPGSVIVDLAASTGGNCACTKNESVISVHGVTIVGNSFLASTVASDASKMFSKNVTNFLALIIKDGNLNLNFEDDIVAGTCLTKENKVVHDRVLKTMQA